MSYDAFKQIQDYIASLFADQADDVSAPRYGDMLGSVVGINPAGPANAPGVDSDDGSLLFDSGLTESVVLALQLPHSYAEGTPIMPHLHWAKTTSAAGSVAWSLQYRWANPGGVLGAWSASELATPTAIVDGDTEDQHAISAWSAIDMTGAEISAIVQMKISRIGGDASDTYGADAKLLYVDCHYQLDSLGSVGEYTK